MIRITLLLMILTLPTVSATPMISGILYNPDGDDNGHEWIELYNPNTTTYSGTCRLDHGNGAQADDWSTQWEDTITIPAASHLSIGEEEVPNGTDVITSLSLQNGPDAVRLICENTTVDLIGWGDHTHSMYYENTPAPQAEQGQVLSRRLIDDNGVTTYQNTNNNSADLINMQRAPMVTSTSSSRIGVSITVANRAPNITTISDCTDHSSADGLQVAPDLAANTTVTCRIVAEDPDNDTLHIDIVARNAKGTVSTQTLPLKDPMTIPLPADIEAGTLELDITVSDASTTSQTHTITFTVLPTIGMAITPTIVAWHNLNPLEPTPRTLTVTNTGNGDSDITVHSSFSGVTFDLDWAQQRTHLTNTTPLPDHLSAGEGQNLTLTPRIDADAANYYGTLTLHAQASDTP